MKKIASRHDARTMKTSRLAFASKVPGAMFALLAALLIAGSALRAEIIGVDTFDYPNAAIAGQSGGTFWDYKNVAPAAR